MRRKEYSPVAQAISTSARVPISGILPAEFQNLSKGELSFRVAQKFGSDNDISARYMPPVYPYTPSRAERRQYVHAKLRGVRGEPAWVKEPWRKQQTTDPDSNDSRGDPTISSISPSAPQLPSPGRQLSSPTCQFSPPALHLSPTQWRPSPPQCQLSPTIQPTPVAQILPPPKLQPLLFPPMTPAGSNAFKAAAHATWWARISNSLASYSARSYHLFVASSSLTCKTEELLLLYEVRKLNVDGKMLFEEVLRELRARIVDWEGSIDELRISWDMESKRDMVVNYDAFVAEQVGRLER
jgi:hypothetical protein